MDKLNLIMTSAGIDPELTGVILDKINSPGWTPGETVKISSFPGIDGKSILDLRDPDLSWSISSGDLKARAEEWRIDLDDFLQEAVDGTVVFSRARLEALGQRLYPLVAYGILNGGSATSYGDRKKNEGFHGPLFSLYETIFSEAAPEVIGRPKGITPAYTNPDGSPGFSYLELKLRDLGLRAAEYETEFGPAPRPLFPLFQMTSGATDRAVARALEEYRSSEALSGLRSQESSGVLTAVQPLIGAFTASDSGRPRTVFLKEDGLPLALPGGHGQSFLVLKEIYRELLHRGYRYAYLGNVDNMANTVDPVSLAVLGLSGKAGGFEFSFKTPVDTKGGILIRVAGGRLNCGDIGPAVSPEAVSAAEAEGRDILFNCATGFFDLRALNETLDEIIEGLPLRLTDQDKDAGRYSQAEQVTWEVIGLLDEFLVFGVDKFSRFLAAKLLLENFLTSGTELENPRFPGDMKELGENLDRGFQQLMTDRLKMKCTRGRWHPV